MGFSFVDYTKGTPGETKSNPLAQLLAGIQAQQQFKAGLSKTQADTGKTQAETQFLPVERATGLANAMRLNNRFGAAYQTLSWLRGLPKAQQAAWIAANKDQYAQIMDAISTDQDQQRTLGQFLTQIGQKAFGQGQGQGQGANADSLNPALPGLLQNMGQRPGDAAASPEGAPPASANDGLPAPFGQDKIAPDADQSRALASAIAQQQNKGPGQNDQQPSPGMPPHAMGAANGLSPLLLNHESNRDAITGQTKISAESSAQMEKFLGDNRPRMQRVANEIKQYSNYMGRGQEWVDAKLKNVSPQAYNDLVWFKESFLPALSNRVGFTENASVQPGVRNKINDMINAFGRPDLDPESALKVFNDKIDTLSDLADSSFNAAEPYHKGTWRQVYGVPRLKGPYITSDKDVPAKGNVSSNVPAGAQAVATAKDGKQYYKKNGSWFPAQ